MIVQGKERSPMTSSDAETDFKSIIILFLKQRWQMTITFTAQYLQSSASSLIQ